MWSRTLLVRPDGTRDEATSVTWLQGRTMFADIRQPPGQRDLAWLATQEGFAGVLADDADCVAWQRRIDFQPASPHPDVGRLWFEGDTLVERGRDSPYVERWRRGDEPPEAACWGAVLKSPEGRPAMVVRAGAAFMFARDRATPLPPGHLRDHVAGAGTLAEARALLDCELSLGRVGPGGWVIDRSTLPNREGVVVRPTMSRDRLTFGADWAIAELEGDPVMA